MQYVLYTETTYVSELGTNFRGEESALFLLVLK